MSVTAQTPYKSYTAAPGATLFTTDFRLLLASDLVVKVDSVVVATGFTVSGIGAVSSEVTFGTPMVGGEIIELQRNVPKTRATDYQQLGDYQASSVNADFDRIVMMLQDVQFNNNLAVSLPKNDAAAPMILPNVAARASRFFAFDADGNATVEAAVGVSSVSVSAFMATVLDDLTAAAARTTLGAAASGANTDITSLQINTSSYVPTPSIPTPVKITNSNTYSNIDTYGSGAVKIENIGVDNNQPVLMVEQNLTDLNLGNGVLLQLHNRGGAAILASEQVGAAIELNAPNPAINNYNGKFKLLTISGYASGAGYQGSGLFTISSRKSDNSRYERLVDFNALASGGRMEYYGEGIHINPNISDVPVPAGSEMFFRMTNPYTVPTNVDVSTTQSDVNVNFTATSNSNKVVQEIVGGGGTYSRVRARTGTAFSYTEATTGNATNEVRSYGASGAASLNLYTATTSGFRIVTTATYTEFRMNVAGVQTALISLNPASNITTITNLAITPPSTNTPTVNGELRIEATSNTSLTFRYKGSDGVVRSASLTLA